MSNDRIARIRKMQAMLESFDKTLRGGAWEGAGLFVEITVGKKQEDAVADFEADLGIFSLDAAHDLLAAFRKGLADSIAFNIHELEKEHERIGIFLKERSVRK